jgi:E3 ubiquitin-protein ligase SIAH1
VEAILLPCPNAIYGCAALLTRYCLFTHRRSCNYAPMAGCPSDVCSFAGSAEALLDHFISVEKWPYTAESQPGKSFDIRLWGGFNVVGAVRGTIQHLLVLFVARRPFGTTLSAVCICPQPQLEDTRYRGAPWRTIPSIYFGWSFYVKKVNYRYKYDNTLKTLLLR